MRSRRRRAVIRSMPGAVLALDTEQCIMSINKFGEQMLGIKESEARGRLLQECTRQPDLNHFVQEAFASDGRSEDEFDIETPEQVIVQAASRPLRNPSDEVVGRVLVLQDVTRLRRLERVRRDFAANVSHELRTPITNIRGYLETVQDSAQDLPTATQDHLAVIARNAERLWLIVEDMLDLARLEDPDAAGALTFSPTPVADLIHRAVDLAKESAEGNGVRLEPDCDESISVRASPRLMTQALSNLLSNAIRHSPEGGIVRVSATVLDAEGKSGDRSVEIAVEDSGPGIEKMHVPRLFERFYRVDPARSRADGGTGLGLAIVKHVARLHSGREGVESVLGRGSRFWIRLPMHEATSGD
jgi:two-component system phosphate regulon sensor histidine kinase PhoR